MALINAAVCFSVVVIGCSFNNGCAEAFSAEVVVFLWGVRAVTQLTSVICVKELDFEV
jgi:hypothetical protein